jgi:hypothetical protein
MVYDNSTYIILNPIGEPCLWITWGYTPRVRDLLLEPRILSPRKNKQPRGFFLLHIWYIMIHLYLNDISFGAFLSHVAQNHPKLEWSNIYIKQYQAGRTNALWAIPMTFQMETSIARDLRDVGALVSCSLLNHLGSSPETARPVTRTGLAGPPMVFFRMKTQWENIYIYVYMYIYMYIYNKLGFNIPKWSSNFARKVNL